MDSGFRLGGPGMTPVLWSSQAARGHLGQTANGSRGVNSPHIDMADVSAPSRTSSRVKLAAVHTLR